MLVCINRELAFGFGTTVEIASSTYVAVCDACLMIKVVHDGLEKLQKGMCDVMCDCKLRRVKRKGGKRPMSSAKAMRGEE
jgi:hypothetical protein